MINRAKRRHIAYVFATITFVFIMISFIISQKKHSESNWYVTVKPGDKAKIFTLLPNITYTLNSDDYITYYAFMHQNENGGYIVDCSFNYNAPVGLEKILGGARDPICLKTFNITCKDTAYFTLNVQLSGFISESGYYEIHKGKSEGRSIYYSNKKHQLVSLNEFNSKK